MEQFVKEKALSPAEQFIFGDLKMICPYCHDEMKAGYLIVNTQLGHSNIKWSESGKISYIAKSGRKGETLPQTGFLGRKVQSQRCTHCHKIIINY